ncbi:MAG: nucleoside deaminase, partial [Gemmatimonadales bacterium]
MRRGPPTAADLAGMEHALRQARAAAVVEEVPVGAVIVREGEVLAEAHNETIRRRDPTAHAEMLALRLALERSGESRLLDATMYITLE